MKYKVLGPRVLIKVKKYEEKNDSKFEGTSILMPEQLVETETTTQTTGEVVQLGRPLFKEEGPQYEWNLELKEGDKVHFQRYGAQRINIKQHKDFEYWIINVKDLLVQEEA